MRIAIVIPTYNEAENVKVLLPRLRRILEELEAQGHETMALFVDDSSPDLTWKIVEDASRSLAQLRLLRRARKEGLGSAYVEGFSLALNEWHADVVVQMDADLQHPPELIPRLVEQIAKGADVSIASRYVPRGAWSRESVRALLSKLGNRLLSLRFWLSIRDVTSGFRALSRSAALTLLSSPGLSKGFLFQLDQTRVLARCGARMVEVPYVFRSRKRGRSKFSALVLLSYLAALLRRGP